MATDEARRSNDAVTALAHAAGAVVAQHDLAGSLVSLLDDCCRLLSSHAAGLLALAPDNSLELLSATSHASGELELYQIQVSEGPCLDAIHRGVPTTSDSSDDMVGRWPAFGAAAVRLGIRSLRATPMSWHGQVIGALNLFRRTAGGFDEAETELLQAFTDVATITIVARQQLAAAEITSRVQEGLAGRTVIEQAKGVVAFEHNLEMAAAYDLLKREASDRGLGLSDYSQQVVAATQQPPSAPPDS